MPDPRPIPDETLDRLTWPLRLTRAGLAAERLTRAFWPVWTLVLGVIAALGFRLHETLPVEVVWPVSVLAPGALVWFLIRGLRVFRWPSHAEAIARLDSRLPGRPLSALTDTQALGSADGGSSALWRAHLDRMAQRAAGAKAPVPDLRLSARDRWGLRYVALTAFIIAALFGTLRSAGDLALPGTGPGAATADAGPSWEGWAEPPAYTGFPALYLNGQTAPSIDLPKGTRVTIRLYGTAEDLTVQETLSGAPAAPAPAPGPVESGTRVVTFDAMQSGRLAVDGAGARAWDVTVLPDDAPEISFAGDIEREADGTMVQPFTAADDFAVAAGRALITLDLPAVPRVFGLVPDPERQEDLVYDLPMPITGSRAEFTEAMVEDASKHPWANLPVLITLEAVDALGQTGRTEPRAILLPGRRFFDPLAAALIEERRALLWNRTNGAEVASVLRAVTYKPEGFIRSERAYLMLRVLMGRLDAGLAQGLLSPELRDETAEALWQVAVLIEDGGLSDALARMKQAQERLSEAIRNGASPDEIQKLMDELRDATDDYLRQLAERGETQENDDLAQNPSQNSQQITTDQLQQMMDEIQRLMEEGRMAEAQELLDQLSRLMENLQVAQGQNGEGQNGPGDQAMRGLQDTLRGQQDLSDESFRNLQGEGNQRQGGGQQQGQGQGLGTDPQTGQDGQGDGQADDPRTLAERQRALREELDRQRGNLPQAGGDIGDDAATQRALEDAGRAMDEAEQALRDGDLPGAIDRQADAIRNLREGLRNLGEAIARAQPDQPGNQGDPLRDAQREMPRDPLGRTVGQNGRVGTEDSLLQGDDVYRRARDLLDEIRRRSGDQDRPEIERDYLKRLLNLF